MYPKKTLAQLVVSACTQFNIDTVVISPGSRNAPLTVGFYNYPEIKALSVVDERCAAFFALGIAQQTQKPVAIVCTSGSALLNYYPAIAEAFYSNIPLVVISADRPKYLIDIGDGQTIRQKNVFENHILFSANLVEGELENNTKLLVKALETSIHKKGPVHINVPFDEPLYETVEKLENFEFEKIDVTLSAVERSQIDYQKLNSIWNSSTKKLILVGTHFPSEELQSVLNTFAKDNSVLVMTETTSNLHNNTFVNSIDKLIFSFDEAQFKQLQPEVLVTFGGMVISKKIKQFLRKYQPKHHWHIDALKLIDTYFCLSEFIQEKPVKFFNSLQQEQQKNANEYQQIFLSLRDGKGKKHKQFLANCAYSDLKVFETILESIPDNCQLQISNSSIIRYTQLFNLKNTLRVFCNRGTSGIDGSTSTAIGAAYSTTNKTVFITGDLSFFYDSNALWNVNIPKDFRIILINNSGGGIFKIIPGPATTNAADYFETPHSLTAKHLAKMYAFNYSSVNSLEELNISLSSFYSISDKPKILEIFTPRDVNNVVLRNYFKNL